MNYLWIGTDAVTFRCNFGMKAPLAQSHRPAFDWEVERRSIFILPAGAAKMSSQLGFVEVCSIKEPAAEYQEYTAASELPSSDLILTSEIVAVYGQMVAGMSSKSVSNLNGRLERGLTIALSGHVYKTALPGEFWVAGKVKPFYHVDLEARTCNCPDCGMNPKNHCKHRVAAYLIAQVLSQPRPTVSVDPVPTEATESLKVAEPEPEYDYDNIPGDDVELEEMLEEYKLLPKRDPINLDIVGLSAIGMFHGPEGDIRVEVLEVIDDQYYIRALPVDGEPIFPFGSPFDGTVCYSTTTVSRKSVEITTVITNDSIYDKRSL